MKPILAAAAILGLGLIATSASAHPTGDGHHFRNGYFQPHAPAYQGYGHQGHGHKGYGHKGYGHRGHGYKGHGYKGYGHRGGYHGAYQPDYNQPVGVPQYQQPAYAPQPQYQYQQPQYQQPQYQQPAYAPQPDYRDGYGAQPYGPAVSFGPGAGLVSRDIPASEGFNVGYSGGPTIGRDRRRLVNGVEVFGPPR